MVESMDNEKVASLALKMAATWGYMMAVWWALTWVALKEMMMVGSWEY